MIQPLKIRDLSIKIPIIQGGMGVGVSKSRLASAVAREGGLGVISGAQIGYTEDDFETNPLEANKRALRKEIRKAKENSDHGAIGVNLMVAMQNYAEFVKIAVEEKVDVIISGAGLPLDLPDLVKGSTTKIVPIVSSLRGAQLIMRRWKKKYDTDPDAIIIEGSKAGGHLGFNAEDLYENTCQSLKEIVGELSQYLKEIQLKIPIIAAGGLFTKKDIEEVIACGASGVQIGTRFVVTEECDASQAYKDAYLNANEEDIKIMMSPVGLPGRALGNAFLKHVEEVGRVQVSKCYRCVHKCDPKSTPFCITKALIDAVNGKTDEGLVFVGAGAYRVHEMTTVKAVIEELKRAFDH